MTKFINNKIEYLELGAGFGKTYTTLKWIVEDQIPKKEKWVYVGKSIELIEESSKLVEDFGCTSCVTITKQNYDKVMESTIEELGNCEEVDIFMITHANFSNVIDNGHTAIFKGFNILIDEMLTTLTLENIKQEKTTDAISKRLTCIEGTNNGFSLTKSKGFLESLKKDGVSLGAVTLASFSKCMQYSNYCYKEEGRDFSRYATYHVRDYKEVVSSCKRFVLLAARVVNTLSYGFLIRQGIDLVPFTDVIPTRNAYQNQERITIFYLTSEKRVQGCTSTLLAAAYNPETKKIIPYSKYRNLPNKIGDLQDGYKTVYQEYVDRACELLGDDFLYTVNYIPTTKDYKSVDYLGVPYGTSIPYACHGLNKYKYHTKCLSLFCYKPSNINKEVLKFIADKWDYPELQTKYIDENYREASLQLMTRCKLRDLNDHTTKLTFVVPDLSVAEYIKEYHIPDCNIDNSIALYVPDGREVNGGHNRSDFSKKHKLSVREAGAIRTFKSRWLKKHQVEPTEEELITKLNKMRNKKNAKNNRCQ